MKDNHKEKELIAERFKELREDSGLDQIKFAEKIGIPRQTVSKIETGRQEVSPQVLREIHLKLGVSPEYLLGLRDEKKLDFSKLKSENEQLHIQLEEARSHIRNYQELINFFRKEKENAQDDKNSKSKIELRLAREKDAEETLKELGL